MIRRIIMAIAAMAVGAVGWLVWPASADPFAALRQARDEPIPGALGYTLEPVDDFRPSIDPSKAYLGLVGASSKRYVSVTLAIVHDERGATYGPAWVYITRDLCYFEAKGDFVSVSRARIGDGCAASNLLVQMVDAANGETLGVFPGFDVGGGWLPERLGEAAQAPGTTRFH
jgi:hypothetical protein